MTISAVSLFRDMNNEEIEKEEAAEENTFGERCVAFLLVGAVIGVGGIIFAWRHEIAGFIRHALGEGG